MKTIQCSIGNLTKSADEIVTLTITCTNKEITKNQMREAVRAIDTIAEKPSPLLVDVTQPHSVSFDSLAEMVKGVNILAVAIYAPSRIAQVSAKSIQILQQSKKNSLFPFKVFPDSIAAKEWLGTFE